MRTIAQRRVAITTIGAAALPGVPSRIPSARH
jgi:hypothetical protein